MSEHVLSPGLQVITGDSPYALLAELDATLTAAPLSPFEDDLVVVQSLGMERWVRQQLARRRGCAASMRLPFPAAFCRTLAEKLAGPDASAIDPLFEEEALRWRVFAMLGDDALLANPVYDPLRAFLVDADPAKRYGLARRISARFDEYRLYRPAMLLAWERGERTQDDTGDNPHAAWQAALWHHLVQSHLGGAVNPPMHFARWFLQTIERLEGAVVTPPGLPSRLSVFGISTLPPLFVRLLRAVSRFVPVHFYVLVPHDVQGAESAREHPLFAQFGHASRELVALLREQDASPVTPSRHVRASMPADDSLLHHVQRGLRAPGSGQPTYIVDRSDRSFSVHVCHAPLREMEVLRDQLLDAMASDPSLRPHDILVMVPDVELYAPLAEAVFGGAETESRPRIPHRVADRALARESAPLQAFELLLQLVTSRVTASDVLRLLGVPAVRRRVGLTAAQVEQVAVWVQDAGIRWGWDADDRASRFGLPPFGENSWRLGLDRMMAGYAAGPVDALVDGVLPVAGDLVGDVELLGVFVQWMHELEQHVAQLQLDRSLATWATVLTEVFTWAVEPDGNAERGTYEQVLASIHALQQPVGGRAVRALSQSTDMGSGPVAFEVVRDWLMATLQNDEHAAGFLTGGLTICAMKPMRAIPHRVIAMLGLDDRSYPRRERRPAFDLIGSVRQLGDRDPRADDRQLVLDTLLCAEQRLHLSYVGRSQTNNAEIAPSIVVAELLQYFQQVARTGDDRGHPLLRVEHRLQPFSRAYFTSQADVSTPLFSFDAALAASVGDSARREVEQPFVLTASRAAEPVTAGARLMITLDDLMAAWVNPSQFHAERALSLSLRAAREVVEDDEPSTVDALLRTRLQQRLLHGALQETPRDAMTALLIASGDLPPGPLGHAWHERLARHVAPLLDRVGHPAFLEPLTIDVQGSDWQLVGRLDHQLPGGQWRVRAAMLKPHDLVRAWIAHLARLAAGAAGETRVLALDGDQRFSDVPNAHALLDVLVQGYRRMLLSPAPYFLGAAAAYRKALTGAGAARGTSKSPLEAARAAFAPGGDFAAGDMDDPYVALLWRGRDPFEGHAEAFVELVTAFWEPLDAAMAVVEPETTS